MLFIDVELVDPKTGDSVRKRLDFRIDIESSVQESYASLAAMMFERVLPGMVAKMKENAEKGTIHPA